MKNLLFLAIAFTGLTLSSCNKDQAAVKKLDGTWNVTEYTLESGWVSVDVLTGGIDYALAFENCKLKKEEWCSMSTTATLGAITSTTTQVYQVSGDGTVLESKEDAASSGSATMTIVELSKTEVTFEDVDGPTTSTIKATKQ